MVETNLSSNKQVEKSMQCIYSYQQVQLSYSDQDLMHGWPEIRSLHGWPSVLDSCGWLAWSEIKLMRQG